MGEILKFRRKHRRLEAPPSHGALIPARACLGMIGTPGFRVLTCIAAFADGNNRATISLAHISWITRIGRGDVVRAIHALEQYGLVDVERRQRPNGTSATNIYTIVIAPPTEGDEIDPQDDEEAIGS